MAVIQVGLERGEKSDSDHEQEILPISMASLSIFSRQSEIVHCSESCAVADERKTGWAELVYTYRSVRALADGIVCPK